MAVRQHPRCIVFAGDSITDCGTSTTIPPLGEGYVREVADRTIAVYPEQDTRIVNSGINGHTTRELEARWRTDVVAHAPDRLVVLIGINDCYTFAMDMNGPGPEEYGDRLARMLDDGGPSLEQMVVLSPFLVARPEDCEGDVARLFKAVPAYIETARIAASRSGASFVDLHAVFARHLRYRPALTFAPEPVHPNRTGHAVIADVVMEQLGLD